MEELETSIFLSKIFFTFWKLMCSFPHLDKNYLPNGTLHTANYYRSIISMLLVAMFYGIVRGKTAQSAWWTYCTCCVVQSVFTVHVCNNLLYLFTSIGITYLRDYLNLPPEIVPATLRRQPRTEGARSARPKGKFTPSLFICQVSSSTPWSC